MNVVRVRDPEGAGRTVYLNTGLVSTFRIAAAGSPDDPRYVVYLAPVASGREFPFWDEFASEAEADNWIRSV
jgi:hypothetical protein